MNQPKNRMDRYQLQRGYALADRELLPRGKSAGDFLIGRQARQGIRHALQALCLARGEEYQPRWSTRKLWEQARPGYDLSIGPGILDQYPEFNHRGTRTPIEQPITIIPDHMIMITSDISMILAVAVGEVALNSTE